jgi:hypothetical protein
MEESGDVRRRVQVPLVPASGRQIPPVTNDEALFS